MRYLLLSFLLVSCAKTTVEMSVKTTVNNSVEFILCPQTPHIDPKMKQFFIGRVTTFCQQKGHKGVNYIRACFNEVKYFWDIKYQCSMEGY